MSEEQPKRGEGDGYIVDVEKTDNGDAIITLPLNKSLILKKVNNNFFGQTEFFQKLDKKKFTNMIFYSNKLIVSPLTTHISINKISKKLKEKNFILNKIKNLILTLKNDFSIQNPKIALSGLNPHAGENGIMGYEEKKEISKCIELYLVIYKNLID